MSALPDNAFDASQLVGTPDAQGDDTARYILRPDVYFTRPWLSVPGGTAFIWPLGVEGFDLAIDATLGIHKYIGDNNVEVDVVHRGQENITLNGTLPGINSAKMMQMLRDVVYQVTPDNGKILYLPGILPMPQYVTVNSARFGHAENEMLQDLTYSLEFVRVGIASGVTDPPITAPETPQPVSAGDASIGNASTPIKTTSTMNTLRKVAQVKLGDASRWAEVYHSNSAYFTKRKVPMSRVPDYAIPPGTTLYL